MLTESDQTAKNGVSRLSNMNDSQNQSSFDFVPKSDYNEKWHLENKCLFHNQQCPESEKYETEMYRCPCPLNREFCPRTEDKFKSKTDGSTLNKKSGDWKSDEESIKPPSGSIADESANSEWRWKNPYSISDFARSRRWCRHSAAIAGDNSSAKLLRDLRTIESRYKDPTSDETEKNFLYNVREHLVNYQESCGVPRTEYSFAALIGTMGQATGRSLLALLYVILNIIPVVEVFPHLLRFILDKVINIRNSQDFRQTMIRCVVFATELFSIYVGLMFIFGFIVLPVVRVAVDIVTTIMFCN